MADSISTHQPTDLFFSMNQIPKPLENESTQQIHLPAAIHTESWISTSEMFILLGSAAGGGCIAAAITLPLELPLIATISIVALAALAAIALASILYHCYQTSETTPSQSSITAEQASTALQPSQMHSGEEGISQELSSDRQEPSQPYLPLVTDTWFPDSEYSVNGPEWTSEQSFSENAGEIVLPDFPFEHLLDGDRQIDSDEASTYPDDSLLIDEIMSMATSEKVPQWTSESTALPERAATALMRIPQRRLLPPATPPKFGEAPPPPTIKEINSDLAMQFLLHYEQWMRDIATNDFQLDLPQSFVKKKFSAFLADHFHRINQDVLDLSPEDFMATVLQPIYTTLHSPEHRRELAEELAALEQCEQQRKTPALFIREMLCSKFGNEKIESIFSTLVAELENKLKEYFTNPSHQVLEIENLREKIYAIANSKELLNLKHQLIDILGNDHKDLVEGILNNWSCIGIDIKNHRKLLTKNRKDLIIDRAVKVKNDPQALQKLSEDLSTELPVHESLVALQYPNLETFLRAIPASNTEEFKLMLSRGVVNHELQKRTQFLNPVSESKILEQLGYEMDKYNHHDKIRFSMEELLKGILSSEGTMAKSSAALKKTIHDLSLKTRLEAAGVTENGRGNIQFIVQEIAGLRKHLNEISDNEISKLSNALVDEDLPTKAKTHLLSIKKKSHFETIDEAIAIFFASNAEMIRNMLDRPQVEFREQFHQSIQEHILSSENRSKLGAQFAINEDNISQAITWYQEYQSSFVFEFDQGDHDLQSGFSDGASSAYVNRVMEEIFKNPQYDPCELGINGVIPIDQFHQSAYGIAPNQFPGQNRDLHSLLMPQEILKKRGLKEVPVFLATPETVKEAIIQNLGCLAVSPQEDPLHGGIKLYLKKHVVGMRLDTKTRKFLLFDPHFGPQEFKLIPRKGQDLEQAKRDIGVLEAAMNRTIDAFIELVDWCYSDTTRIIGLQLQPRLPDETIPEDFYQFKESQIFC